MVSALASGSSDPGSRPGQGHCVVFLGKNVSLSQCLSSPRFINGKVNSRDNPAMD